MVSGSDDAVYLSRYAEVPRIELESLLEATDDSLVRGATVFVDSEPAIAGAIAVLPSAKCAVACNSSESSAGPCRTCSRGETSSRNSWASSS